jgi:GntR family transcriptional regulator / MocR family aminotransferase
MPKQLPLLFVLDRTKRVPLQKQISLNFKRLIHSGTLSPGKAVPSSREFACDLQISRNTVLQAYDRLIAEGYLEASPRRGLYVSELLERKSLRKIASEAIPHQMPTNHTTQFYNGATTPVPFRPCQPDVHLFPLQLWNRARTRALRKHGTSLLQYQSHHPLGLPDLRQSLAGYLQGSRGVRCDWRQIAITSGSQQALFLLANLLL